MALLLLRQQASYQHHRPLRLMSTMRTATYCLSSEYTLYHFHLICCILLSTFRALLNRNFCRHYTTPMLPPNHRDATATSSKKPPSSTRKHGAEADVQSPQPQPESANPRTYTSTANPPSPSIQKPRPTQTPDHRLRPTTYPDLRRAASPDHRASRQIQDR
jgi:hypothetical protein